MDVHDCFGLLPESRLPDVPVAADATGRRPGRDLERDDRLPAGVQLNVVRLGRRPPPLRSNEPHDRRRAVLNRIADGDVERDRAARWNRRPVRLDPRTETALAKALYRQQLVVQLGDAVRVRDERGEIAVLHHVREEVPADQQVRRHPAYQLAGLDEVVPLEAVAVLVVQLRRRVLVADRDDAAAVDLEGDRAREERVTGKWIERQLVLAPRDRRLEREGAVDG